MPNFFFAGLSPKTHLEASRPRKAKMILGKLLLNKKEIDYLIGKTKTKGFSLIPLKIYDNSGRIKLEFGLARGKKKFNKKEKIKKRDVEREVNRELHSRE